MLKIDSREALDSIRVQAKEVIDNSKCRILICAGTGCLAGGSAQIHEKMLELVNANPNIEVHFGPEIAHEDSYRSSKETGHREDSACRSRWKGIDDE